MKNWPVTDITPRLPTPPSTGVFWADRGDRRHTGVDVYAPCECSVVSIEPGSVVCCGIFTSPELVSYWHITYYAIVQHLSGMYAGYAELGALDVAEGQELRSGQKIGTIGPIINPSRVNESSPDYIRKLVADGLETMLHFELHAELNPNPPGPCYGPLYGFVMGHIKPVGLLDPTPYLRDIEMAA